MNQADLTCESLLRNHPLHRYSTSIDRNFTLGTVVEAGLWINIECNLGIVCACLPIMRPLFRAISPMASVRSYLWKYSRGTSRTASTREPRGSSFDNIVSSEPYAGFRKDESMELESQVSV